MSKFNMYNLYSYAAGEFKSACDDKILVDLHKLKGMKEYYDVLDYLDKTFGGFEGQKVMDYPNEIKVIMQKQENFVLVAAMKGEEQIFGQSWKFTPKNKKEDI